METYRSYYDITGLWKVKIEGLGEYMASLPGTLDTNGIGKAEEPEIATRLTRVHTYEGLARFQRNVILPQVKEGGRLFLEAERARQLSLEINGTKVEACVSGTLSTPYVFEITSYAGQEVLLELLSDNSYEGWSRKSIIGASAATDETQTNWNGILGYLRLREEAAVFVEAVRVYPCKGGLQIEIDNNGKLDRENYQVKISSPVLEADVYYPAQEHMEVKLSLREGLKAWDEEEGNLYAMTVSLHTDDRKNTPAFSVRTVSFGIREFGINENLRLTLNGRVFFLRGEANCCVFPEEGHPPMTVEEWKKVLQIYASYGVNCMRFHSWCPPEAAFQAADEMGMMMQPELSQWNFKDALADEESMAYYQLELSSVLKYLANHPSFVMLTLGNELLTGEEGHRNMDKLLQMAKKQDSTRLYANSSNGHYGEIGVDKESDFYTSANYYTEMLRATSSPMVGHLNQEYPTARHNYNETVAKVHKDGNPVYGFEVGQYEILPDFKEIDQFRGVTRAVNLELVRSAVNKAGQLSEWERYVEATGELSLLGYREEVEAVLRTPGMSGLSLLGLQDFPGQGTAIVGMLNSHLKSKPYGFAAPERFRQFFAPVVPLLLLEKYTYEEGELLQAEVKLANYGKETITGKAGWRVYSDSALLCEGSLGEVSCENQGLRNVGMLTLDCGKIPTPVRLTVEIYVEDYMNSYPLWVYPKLSELTPSDKGVWTTEDGVMVVSQITGEVLEQIAQGACAYLEPKPVKEKLPGSIGGQFSTDFWSVGTFPVQEGGMGMVIDTEHPVFKTFPTESYSNWQWWKQACGRPMILPRRIHPIITVPDSYSRLKHMGLLAEARYGRGRLMISGMGLQYAQQYPETRALLHSILRYMAASEFQPGQELIKEELVSLFGEM